MSDNPFQPSGNGVAIATSTVAATIQLPNPSPAVVVTNRSQASAWVTWSSTSPPAAAFPVPGDTTGQWGMEVAPMAQVTIGLAYGDVYMSGILSSGTGVMTFIPGDGV